MKLGKDIRSDHDILEEELIKPLRTKSIETNTTVGSTEENLQAAETHDQPSIIQLIKYKQQIHVENDRRVHRQKLAALAKSQRERNPLFNRIFLLDQKKFNNKIWNLMKHLLTRCQ